MPMASVWDHYGGSILAMKGKNCALIISDQRLGEGNITISTSFQRIHPVTQQTYIGLPNFLPDAQKVLSLVEKNQSIFKLREGRIITPQELAHMVSYILYSKRHSPYYTSPVIAGIFNNEPYISGMDTLGSMNIGNFVASGTAYENLLGGCENIYEEGLEPEELFRRGVQVFLSALDRDALSGWGAEAVLILPNRIIKRKIKGRMD